MMVFEIFKAGSRGPSMGGRCGQRHVGATPGAGASGAAPILQADVPGRAVRLRGGLVAQLPQMWEWAALAQVEQQLEEAAELRTAILLEQGSVTLGDRLRGATGRHLWLRTTDGAFLGGTVELAATDCIVLADGPRRHLVPAGSVASVRLGEVPAALPVRGGERVSVRAVLRGLVDTTVEVLLSGAVEVSGRLSQAGADHVVLAVPDGVELISVAAIRRVQWRVPAIADPS